MRKATVPAALAAVMLCGVVPGGAAPAHGQERVLDAGLFRLFQAGRELGRESFRRTAGLFEGEVSVPVLNLKLRYRSEYDPAGRLRRFEARAFDLRADTLRRTYRALVDGDSLRLTQADGSQSERAWTVAATADAVLPGQTIAPLAELAERAAGRDTVYRTWSPEANAIVTVSVRIRGDTAELVAASLPLTAALAPSGRVEALEVPMQRVRAERAGSETLPPLEGIARPAADYSAPPGAPYTAEQVRIPVRPPRGEPFELAGTLTVPTAGRAPYPAAVLISGSGGQNRDEELWPLVPLYRPFRQIAERLAAAGIAVLRADDRGVGESGGSAARATTADLAEDVRAELTWLRARPQIAPARIALIGHSEGGVIAPMLAASDRRIAAIVVMAGSAKPGVEVLVDQAVWPIESATDLSPERRAALRAEAERRVRADTANPAAWIRYFRTLDPLPTAWRVRQPVLILHGALDRQVSVGQADTLAGALRDGGNRDVEVRVFPRLNHLFLVSPTDGSPVEYPALADTAVPREVLDVLAGWLAPRLGRGRRR